MARSAAGALSAVQNISTPGQDASFPQVAVDADGDAVFTWEAPAATNDQIQTRARSAAGALSAVQDLTGAGRDADNPYVAVDPNGNAVFTWARSDLSGFDVIQARARSAAGVLSEVQNLSDSGKNSSAPQVAVDADGDAVFTWVRDVINDPVQARARSAAGALSPVQDISYPGQAASAPQVAVQASGKAVFTWLRFDGSNDRVQARTRSAAGALRPLTTLSDPGQDAAGPQVGVDADGDALVAWELDDGASPGSRPRRGRSRLPQHGHRADTQRFSEVARACGRARGAARGGPPVRGARRGGVDDPGQPLRSRAGRARPPGRGRRRRRRGLHLGAPRRGERPGPDSGALRRGRH